MSCLASTCVLPPQRAWSCWARAVGSSACRLLAHLRQPPRLPARWGCATSAWQHTTSTPILSLRADARRDVLVFVRLCATAATSLASLARSSSRPRTPCSPTHVLAFDVAHHAVWGFVFFYGTAFSSLGVDSHFGDGSEPAQPRTQNVHAQAKRRNTMQAVDAIPTNSLRVQTVKCFRNVF